MVQWFLFRDGTFEPDLINIQYIDSANPFGDYIVAQIEDNLGQTFDKYPFGTKIQVDTDDDGDRTVQFLGFVVERRESDQQGQDVLEVEAYSFDQFLRQNDVSNDQSGKLISDAIQDIVQTDTPVSYNPSKVNVIDDFELRRPLQGERVETALQILSFDSGNEGFGVDGQLDFFFEPREQNTVSRGIDNTEWFNYDIPERGKEAINEVEVRFDDGNRSVVVDNPGQKLQIQDSLNLPDPATQRARIARPNITNSQDAESEGRRFLELKNVTLTGTITTFGLFNAEPFDTINAEIIPRGIDNEFIITQIEYNWGRDETTLTIVENRGFDEDLFVRLSEKAERIDLRDSDPQAVEDRITSANVAASVNTEVSISQPGVNVTATTTNDGVNKILSGWQGEGNPQVSDIVTGSQATGLSRSDSDLENQNFSDTISNVNFPTPQSVEFQASVFSSSNAEEVGLKDSSGTLISRGVFDSPDLINATVTFTVTIDDATESNGVVTQTGQTAIRDIIADNNPQTPTRYAFGSNQSQPAETDTSLTNETEDTNLKRVQLQNIDTPSEFESTITPSISDDSPVTIDQVNGAVTVEPVTYIGEAENGTFEGNIFQSVSTLSNDTGIDIGQNLRDFVTFQFTLNQDVPANELTVGTYAELDDWRGTVDYFFDGQKYTDEVIGGSTSQNRPSGVVNGVNDFALEAGTTHTIRAETVGIVDGNHVVDVMFAFDNRSQFNITTPASSAFNGDTYDFPELFPDESSVSFAEVSTRREITELELVQTWNDTSNSTSVTLNLGSQSKTVFNPTIQSNGRIRETLSVNQSNAARSGSVDITLSRFIDTSSISQVPRLGSAAQRMSFHILDANPDAITRSNIGEATTRAIFRSGSLTSTLRESGQKAGANLLTHSIFADVDPGNDNIIASEQIQFVPK
jgi:hypothetical protein